MKKIFCSLIAIISLFIFQFASGQNKVVDEYGNEWQTFKVNDISVFLNITQVKKFGKYLQLSLYIQNDSQTESVDFDFSQTSVKKGDKIIPFFTKSEFEKKVRSRQRWNEFGAQMASVATAVTVDAALGTTKLGRHHHSFGGELLRGLTYSMINGSIFAGNVVLSEVNQNQMEKIIREDLGYLKSYTIEPLHSVTGFAYARFRGDKEGVVVNIPIGGKIFAFQF